MVLLALVGAATLIATAALALVLAGAARSRHIVYGICLIASLALLLIALLSLVGIYDSPSVATLPLGIPWLGAHFRLDALSAFFLAVVNLGAAAASLFALGYGRHETRFGRDRVRGDKGGSHATRHLYNRNGCTSFLGDEFLGHCSTGQFHSASHNCRSR
jgi:formate hydrogenlyase subunit 3/multisubunit Na+/H+ antiporter MnhD subunit